MTITAAVSALAIAAAPAGWTADQWNGVEKTLAQIQSLLDAGGKPTKVRATKLVIGGNVGRSANCARVTAQLSAAQIVAFGVDPALVTTPASRYVSITVCGNPTSQKSSRVGLLDTALVDTISAPFSSDPGQDAFQIALRDDSEAQAASTGFQCACATGPACQWTRPLITGGTETIQCPRGLTLMPGTWSGSDTVRTPCMAWAGADSIDPRCTP